MLRRIYPTRYGQMHLRSNEGKGVPLVLLHMSPRSGAMWELLQEKLERPTHAPDRLGYGFSDAPPWALSLEQYAQATIDERIKSLKVLLFYYSRGNEMRSSLSDARS